ncbi:MAG: GNAT family N-acetyltransferase [Desulfotalea sp.]
MLVQKLSEGYLAQFVDLVDQYREFCGFNKSPKKTKEFFQNLLTNNEANTFIAINAEDEVMGFVNLYPSYSTLALRKIWILNDLGVSAKFRRMGVAQALIAEVIGFAKTSGAIRIELKTEITNRSAQKLYSEIGFAIDNDNIYYKVPLE